MNTCVLLVLQDNTVLNDILIAWKKAGGTGITVLPSMGMSHLMLKPGLREDLPMMPGIDDLSEVSSESNHTLFTIVPDELTADRIIEATERITGSLDLPNTGIIAVLPVIRVVGLNICTD